MPDSLLFLSAYRYRDNFDIELAYFDFAGRIRSIESELYKRVTEITETVLCFTAKKNFRHTLYKEYKANRKANETEDALSLKENVKKLKRLAYERLKPMCYVSNEIEADDSCIMYAYKGYYVSAMDSDVVNQCPTPIFNFHGKHWKWEHEGKDDKDIFFRIIYESIKGKAKDNVKGVDKAGDTFASLFVSKLKGHDIDISKNRLSKKFKDILLKDELTFNDYIELFDIPEEMLLNYRLCDVSQYKNEKLELASIESIANGFSQYCDNL